MDIQEFIQRYKNHPVLFVGAGISMRYLENSYTWDGLLSKVAFDLMNNEEYYLELKYRYKTEESYDFPKIATEIEKKFDEIAENDRNGKFKLINDTFYDNLKRDIKISRFKIYISILLSELKYRPDKIEELKEFKKIRKNISSIITTNYDYLIENIFEFIPLIGNNILLSNPYGSVYKIHGCIKFPNEIVITEEDYIKFNDKYELIRAQLLSLFIHNPIIFIGYSIEDRNIKNLLRTIFTYVDPKSEIANKIRNNFLLVEYEENVNDTIVTEYDIKLENFPLIRINKIKTDNFSAIYKALSNLHLPISAMDIRKVENIVKEIHEGGKIKVHITEDLDKLSNSDKVLAIGSTKTIKYDYQTSSEMISNYFDIIAEENKQLLSLIDKQQIQSQQYFPIFGFSLINSEIEVADKLKVQQNTNLKKAIESIKKNHTKIVQIVNEKTTITDILNNEELTKSNKLPAILFATMNDYVELDDLEGFLKEYKDKTNSNYRKILCAYDLKKYGEQ